MLLAGLLAGGLAAWITFGPTGEARADDGRATLDRTTAATGGAPATELPPVAEPSPASNHHPRDKTWLKRRWGVEVLSVRQTAAGHMLEFRYRVLDAAKARPLFERQIKPVLTDAGTGVKLAVPTPATTGALRNSNPPLAGRTYWMFFNNPGGMVKPGNHVSIKIGDFRADDLVVQ